MAIYDMRFYRDLISEVKKVESKHIRKDPRSKVALCGENLAIFRIDWVDTAKEATCPGCKRAASG